MKNTAPQLNESPASNLERTPKEFSHALEAPVTRGNTVGIPSEFGGTALANVKTRILTRRTVGTRTVIIVCNPHPTSVLYLAFSSNPIVGQGIPIFPNGGSLTIQRDFAWNDELWITSDGDYSWSGVEFWQ